MVGNSGLPMLLLLMVTVSALGMFISLTGVRLFVVKTIGWVMLVRDIGYMALSRFWLTAANDRQADAIIIGRRLDDLRLRERYKPT